MDTEDYLTASEVAKLVKLSLPTIRRLTMNNQIPNTKFIRAVRYSKSEIVAWLAERTAGKSGDKAGAGAENNEGNK